MPMLMPKLTLTLRFNLHRTVAQSRAEPHAVALLASDNSDAVVLDLVQPLAAGRQCCGLYRKARRDKAGRDGTLQQVA